jgi:p70 ribosomal S6 kinase
MASTTHTRLTPARFKFKPTAHQAHSLLKGLLERNVQKRLGSTKSTMFEVGGVAALKAHRFFKGIIHWQLLARKGGATSHAPPPRFTHTHSYTYVHCMDAQSRTEARCLLMGSDMLSVCMCVCLCICVLV